MNKLTVIFVLMMMLASVEIVGAESQSWHLLDETYTGMTANDGTNHHTDLFMNKTGNSTGSYISLRDMGNTTWWYAEYDAQFDGLGFEEGNWIVNISHGPTDGGTIWVDICKVNDTTGEVTYLANGSVVPLGSGSDTFICYDNSSTAQSFNKGERLALRIYHNRPDKKSLRIYFYKMDNDRYSNLSSPVSDPGYPIPELSTLALTSLGLVALAGYAIKNKKGQ